MSESPQLFIRDGDTFREVRRVYRRTGRTWSEIPRAEWRRLIEGRQQWQQLVIGLSIGLGAILMLSRLFGV